MLNAEEQDPQIAKEIRACATEMLRVADILKASGSEHHPALFDTEQSMRRAAVQLYGYFPQPQPEFKAPSFQLRAPHSSPQTRTLTESLAGYAAYIAESPLSDNAI